MHALKTPAFFRPTSRPSSPAPTSTFSPAAAAPPPRPESALGLDRVARLPNKLSLSTFRRPSPSPAARTAPSTPVPLVQDGTYLEMLALKLSEAVSRSLAQPTGPAMANEMFNGKRPIPAGRGKALGALIASEVNASRDSQHLHRATTRSLHRPLSVLITNLSAHLLPVLSAPTFHSSPAPTVQSPTPNPSQLHAIALATFAGELLETFGELGLGQDPGELRGDGLKGIRDGLESVISRVLNPLINGIKGEVMPLLEALEFSATSVGKTTTNGKALHPSVIALQSTMPIYSKALHRYTTTAPTQMALTTFLISVIWRGLVALAHRVPPPPTPPPSPGKKASRRASETIPGTPPSARFTIKLPPSRPPSPPARTGPPSAAADARVLHDLLNMLPRPIGENSTARLAREAVDDAFDGLKALAAFLEGIPIPGLLSGVELHERLDNLTADLPTLVALPAILRAYGPPVAGNGSRSVASMLGLSEDEYRRGCLAGFGRAEECTIAVSRRVLDTLRVDKSLSTEVIRRWLEHEIVLAEQ